MYAYSEKQLNEPLESIEKLSSDFYQYMVKNWKHSWCLHEQKDLFTMFNSTTNRIEAECLNYT